MDVSTITVQHRVYQPVVVASSVRTTGIKSLSHLRFLANASWEINWALGRGGCMYTYPGGTPSFSDIAAPSLTPGGAGGTGGNPGRDGVGLGGGAPVSWRPRHVCGSFAMPFWQGRQPSVRFLWTVARCLSFAAFTFVCPETAKPRLLSAPNSAWAFLMKYCISPNAARENPPLAIWRYLKLGTCQTVLAVPDLLHCRSGRDFEDLQDMNCGFKIWD